MPAFKGGPALPKRSSHTMSASSAATATLPKTNPFVSFTPSKRKRRTTNLLSNSAAEMQDNNGLLSGISTASRGMDNVPDIKPYKSIGGADTTVPVSQMRSTANKTETIDMMNMDDDDDDDDEEKTREGSNRFTKIIDDSKDVKEAAAPSSTQPSTPKKATKGKANKETMKTPTKKEPTAGPSTPRTPEQAPLASAWQPEHWTDLNFAILKVVHDHSSELFEASPSLVPWKIKGRLLVKIRQLLKDASGGDGASKRWDTEEKPNRGKGSPRKSQPPQM